MISNEEILIEKIIKHILIDDFIDNNIINLNYIDDDGNSLLMIAFIENVHYFYRKKGDPKPLLTKSQTIKNSLHNCLKLLELNCMPHYVNKMGYSPLIWACQNNFDKKIILKLLNINCNPKHISKHNKTALDYAIENNLNLQIITKIIKLVTY